MFSVEKVLVAILCFLLVLSCFALSSQNGESANTEVKDPAVVRAEYIAECEDLSYSDICRNPDNYMGKKAFVHGTVIEVQEGMLDSAIYRVQTDYGIWYVTYTRKDGESRILENDHITCYGECKGVETYLAVLGNTVTIPSLRMEYYATSS